MSVNKKIAGLLSVGILFGGSGYLFGKWKKLMPEEMVGAGMDRRLLSYYDITTKWIENMQNGLDLGEYLLKKRYKNIAIYGHGMIGILLYNEIKKSDINIKYFVDKTTEKQYESIDGIHVIAPGKIKEQEKTDAIIITPVFEMDQIERILRRNKYNGEVLNLNRLVYECQS